MKTKMKVLLVLGFLLMFIPSVFAATVSVSSASESVGSDITLDVDVDPQGVPSTSGTVFLTYDPTKLTYVEVTDNNYFSMSIPPTVTDLSSTRKRIEITQFTVGGAKSNVGLWAKVKFTVLAAGTVDVDITTAGFTSLWGSNAFTGKTAGQVTVGTTVVACTVTDWNSVNWGACDAICGPGTQTGTVSKKLSSACDGIGGKPATTQSCNLGVCAAECAENQDESTGCDCILPKEVVRGKCTSIINEFRKSLDADDAPNEVNPNSRLSIVAFIAGKLRGFLNLFSW